VSCDLPVHDLTSAEKRPFRARFTVIATLAALFFFNFLARFIWGPLLPSIESDLGISHTGAGALFLFIATGYFFGVLASGFLSSKFDHQKTITLSSLSCGLALIAASTGTSLAFLRLVFVLIGITAGFYLPSGIASLTYGLAPRDFGKAFSIHEISPSLGFIAAPLLAEAVMSWGSWRGVVWPIAAGLIATGIYYAVKRPTGDFKGDPPTWSNMRRVLSQSAFWLMLVVFALAVAANVGVFSMIPLYLQAEKGMGQSWTHFIMSASRTTAMASPLIAGWLCARYRPRAVMAAVTLMSGITTALIGLAADHWLWVPILLQPVFAAAFFPPAFAVLMGFVEEGLRNLVIALIMPFAMLMGGGAFPTFLGAFGDRGIFFVGFALTGTLVVASISLIFFIRIDESPIRTRRIA
jgi:NNP family nitrate/nitrite transporter-like MFS transporter